MLGNDSFNWVDAFGLKKVQVTVSGTQPIKIPLTDTFTYTYNFAYKYYVLMDCSNPKNPTLAGYSADFKESNKGIKIPFSANWIPVPKKYKKYKKAKLGGTGQLNYTSSVKNGLLSKGVDGDTTHEIGLEVDVGVGANLDIELKLFSKVLWDYSVKRGGAVTFKTKKARFSCEEKCEKDEGEK